MLRIMVSSREAPTEVYHFTPMSEFSPCISGTSMLVNNFKFPLSTSAMQAVLMNIDTKTRAAVDTSSSLTEALRIYYVGWMGSKWRK
jgi:hypothetical protein